MGMAPIMGPPILEPVADPAKPGELPGEPEPEVSPVPTLCPAPARGSPLEAPVPLDAPEPPGALPPDENGKPERGTLPPAVALSGRAPADPPPIELAPPLGPCVPSGDEEDVPLTVRETGDELEARPLATVVPVDAGAVTALPDRPGPEAVALTGRVPPPADVPTPAGMTPDAAFPEAVDVPVTGEPVDEGEPPPPAGDRVPELPPPPAELDAAWVAASTPVRDAPPVPPSGEAISRFHNATGDTLSVPTPFALPTRWAGVKARPERFALSRRGL